MARQKKQRPLSTPGHTALRKLEPKEHLPPQDKRKVW